MKLIDDSVLWIWEQYQLMKLTGHLPYGGGYSNQPAGLIEGIIIINSTIEKVKNDHNYQMYLKGKDSIGEHKKRSLGDIADRRKNGH